MNVSLFYHPMPVKAFKKWLKVDLGLMEGTTENWISTKMEVQSLAELKARSGIETDLF